MTDVRHILRVDGALARRAVAPLSEFWRSSLHGFFTHPTAKSLVGRIGRRGGKSTTGVKVAIAETVFREWVVPPGEVHWFCFISIDRVEAGERLRTLKHYLELLEIPFDVSGDVVTLRDAPLGFRILTGSVGGVSGYSVIGAWCDEVAKWTSAEHAANPCESVIASLAPAMVQHADARLFIMSSAFGAVGYHYELIEAGTTEQNIVISAATWEANPSLTKEQTRARARSERSWLQEYANVPTETLSSAFDYAAVDGAFRDPLKPFRSGGRAMVIDPSSGRKDGFTSCIVSWCHPPQVSRYLTTQKYVGAGMEVTEYERDEAGQPIENPDYEREYKPPFIRFEGFWQQAGTFWQSKSSATIVQGIAAACKRQGIGIVHSDQREAYALEAMFAAHGLRFMVHTYTNPNKIEAVERIQRWLADRSIVIAPNEELSPRVRQQLVQYDMKIRRSGAVTFAGRGTTPDDLATLLVTAALADIEGTLALSPAAAPAVRRNLTNLPPG